MTQEREKELRKRMLRLHSSRLQSIFFGHTETKSLHISNIFEGSMTSCNLLGIILFRHTSIFSATQILLGDVLRISLQNTAFFLIRQGLFLSVCTSKQISPILF